MPLAPVTAALHPIPPPPPTFPATKLDGLPNQLTPAEPFLCLLDVGFFVNTSCPPLLRPTRDVDLILSLDYNLHGAFEVGIGQAWGGGQCQAWPQLARHS